jgi:hypothetical protein
LHVPQIEEAVEVPSAPSNRGLESCINGAEHSADGGSGQPVEMPSLDE